MHRHWFGERQRHRTTDVDEFVPFQRFVVVVRSNLNITMRSIWQKMLTERGYLHRGVVLLLLLLIFADLAGPQRCCGELTLPSSFSATIPISDGGEMSVFSATPADQQRPQPETPESERGCFCCCAHILHSSVHIADIPAVRWSPVALSVVSVPSSPPKNLFHPPRLA
jgi:hypothetical protein